MRLALLKNDSCHCNGNSRDRVAASNQSEDMVKHLHSLMMTKLIKISVFVASGHRLQFGKLKLLLGSD